MVEVDEGAVEVVGEARATRARSAVARPEHDVVGEQLRAPVEELRQGLRSFVGREAVVLLDRNPGQLLPLARELLAALRMLVLALEQLATRREPLLTRCHLVIRHRIRLLGTQSASAMAGTAIASSAACSGAALVRRNAAPMAAAAAANSAPSRKA